MNFEEKALHFLNLSKDKLAADEYYYKELLEEVSERFTQKVVNDTRFKNYEYLIMSVGFSPEPLILWIKAFKPKRVFFIYSPETLKYVEFIAEKTNLKILQCKYEEVNSSNTNEIYEKIKKIIEENHLEDNLDRVAIDITGGKKSMVSGCSLAAAYLGIDLIYVDYEQYQSTIRRPLPGQEFPALLDNPMNVFGDKDLAEGIVKFNAYDFTGAEAIFNNIKNNVSMPWKYEAYAYIAKAYGAWDCLDYKTAIPSFAQAIDLIERFQLKVPQYEVIREHYESLQNMIGFENMAERDIFSNSEICCFLIGDLLNNARRRIKLCRNDTAALLTYRALELIGQWRLALKGIIASEPCYDKLEIDKEKIVVEYNAIGRQLYGENFNPIEVLPTKISLLSGLMLLQILGDSQVSRWKLKTMLASLELRNRSILAHGTRILSSTEAKDFYENTVNKLNGLWMDHYKVQGKEQCQVFLAKFTFPKL